MPPQVDSSARMLHEAAASLWGRANVVECRHVTLDAVPERDTFDPAAALRHLATLVKPGGRLLVIVSRPHWCQWLIWLRWRHKWFSPRHVTNMAVQAGFDRLEVFSFRHGPASRTSLACLAQKTLDLTGADPC
ncbi:MAG: class I SAM-dependent methyltransferase [Hyphomicrobiales bacterium]|nr:class I SAM-dependent methyltransferase [Hyphomicrobiales bacterium]